jgi:hypothetical protein
MASVLDFFVPSPCGADGFASTEYRTQRKYIKGRRRGKRWWSYENTSSEALSPLLASLLLKVSPLRTEVVADEKAKLLDGALG